MYPTEPPQEEPDPVYSEEEHRERRWAYFEGDCRDFAESEPDGWAAVLRAVSRAMKADTGE